MAERRMAETIDYYVALQSPWTYLGHQRLIDIANRHGAEIHVWPVNYGVIFPQTGGLPLPKRAPERQAYRMFELKRWQAFTGVPMNFQPKHFPTDESLAAGMVIMAREQGLDAVGLAGAILAAVWAEEKDIGERDALIETANAVGLDGAALAEAGATAEATARWQSDTEAAVERGVFGAPTYFLRDEPFWGQDRLEFVDRALAS